MEVYLHHSYTYVCNGLECRSKGNSPWNSVIMISLCNPKCQKNSKKKKKKKKKKKYREPTETNTILSNCSVQVNTVISCLLRAAYVSEKLATH